MPVRARLAAVVSTLVVLGVVGAWSAGPAAACDNAAGSYVECQGGGETSDPGSGGSSGGSGGSSSPVDFDVTWVEGGEGEAEGPVDEQGCWGIVTVPQGEGGSWDEAVAEQAQWGENGGAWGSCDPADTIDPAELARTYWYASAAPPPPTPLQVAPGRALTGLPGYLEIGGEVPHVQAIATPIGTLTFTMTPRYVVDWGDGTTTETSSQGGPYPGGDITHTYVEEGGVTITVQAFWRTTWTLAGAGGDLPELPVPTEGSLDLPVEQRQAVID